MATEVDVLSSPPTTLPTERNASRLSIPFPARLPLFGFVAGAAGFCLGVAHGSRETSLRFRAENAHRLPQTQTGWYLYHKSKNYHVILGGVKEGFKMAGRIALLTSLFVVMEEGLDRGRAAGVRAWRRHAPSWRIEDEEGGENERKRIVKVEVPRDFISTTLAGLGTGGAFSMWNGFPLPTAVRLAKMGAKAGLVFGLLQDAVSLMKGRRLGYVEFVKRNLLGLGEGEVSAKRAAVG